jgi:tetratricopeptide (TPR) repeat protein
MEVGAQAEAQFSAQINDLTQQINNQTPNNELYFKRAKLYFELRDFTKAQADIHLLLLNDSLNSNYLFLAARNAQGMGNNTVALNLFHCLYVDDSMNVYTVSQLAKLYDQNQQELIALKYYKRWIMLDSTNLFPKAKIAEWMLKSGETMQSIEMFNAIYAADSAYLPALNMLSFIYYKLYESDSAIKYVEKALAIDADNTKFIERLANVYYQKDHYFRAIPYYKKLIALEDTTPDVALHLGLSLFGIKKYTEALPLLQYAANKLPDNYVPFRYLGECYFQLHDSLKSVQSFEKAFKLIYPNELLEYALRLSLARSYFQAGDFTNSIKYYSQLIEKSVEPLNYYELAVVYDEGLKDQKKALHFFARFLQLMEGKNYNGQRLEYAQARVAQIKSDLHFQGELY